MVRSPEEIAYRVSYNDWFLREITEKGEVLHESDTHYNRKRTQAGTEIGHPTHVSAVKKEKDCMNPLTLEWIEKAEGDYIATQKLFTDNESTVI